MPDACKDYEGENGQERLLDALGLQQLFCGEASIIPEIVKLATLWTYEDGETIIDQAGGGDDLFFILQGRAKIRANKREIRIRKARCHVGEIALLDPEGGRSADVIAMGRCVIARVEGHDFRQLANSAGNQLWRNLARILADRLREHTAAVRMPNDRPHIFLGSSSEARPVMHALARALEGDWAELLRWDEGDAFEPSASAIESLEKVIGRIDFAILVATDEDWTGSRGKKQRSPRDNIVLETGLGIGGLGRRRTFIVTPRRKAGSVKWPSDLHGIDTPQFDDGLANVPAGKRPPYTELDEADLDRMISGVADRLKRFMEKEGVL